MYLEMTCSHLRNDATEERSNSAFVTKILASKLPIIRCEDLQRVTTLTGQ